MHIENFKTKKAHEPEKYALGSEPEEPKQKAGNPLDNEDMRRLHRKVLEWYSQERERQSVNRYQMALDEDFYDGLQWDEQEALLLQERGQAPLVFNLVKPVIDWVIGTERRTRVDFRVLPREEDDVKLSESKTKLLKYLHDVNKAPFKRSSAFADAVKAGIGWLEAAISPDPTEEMLVTRHESWRNMLYDSYGTELDGSDWRYVFRWKWLDLDMAQSYFPDRAAQLRRASTSAEIFGNEQEEEFWYLGQHFTARDEKGTVFSRRSFVSDAQNLNRRERVKVIECWYRQPQRQQVCVGGRFHGWPYNEQKPWMKEAVESGECELHEGVFLRVRVAIFTDDDLIWEGPSPYNHNRFPFTPIWCYRRARDKAPYGMIRNIRDPQEDYNKRASKALFLLSVNRVIGDKEALHEDMTIDDLREEASRPDAIILKRKGAELNIDSQPELADGHILLMDRDKIMLQETGGVTSENLGRQTNATSGKAIMARQEQGGVVTAEPFDNLRLSMQLHGEKELSLIEQFYSAEKSIRITGDDDIDFFKVNEVVDGEIVNDITARQSDFIIGEQDFRQSLRMAMFEALADVVGRLPPEISLQLLDLVFELSDLHGKDKIVKRIQKVNGHEDVDPEKLSPEERAQWEQQQKMKAMQEQMTMETAVAALRKLMAEASHKEAQADQAGAQASKARTESQGKAVETAAQILSAPPVVPVADDLLASAGYQDGGAPAPGEQ